MVVSEQIDKIKMQLNFQFENLEAYRIQGKKTFLAKVKLSSIITKDLINDLIKEEGDE